MADSKSKLKKKFDLPRIPRPAAIALFTLLLNGAIIGYTYLELTHKLAEEAQTYADLEQQSSAMRRELIQIQKDFAYLEENQAQYLRLKESNRLLTANRLNIIRGLETLQRLHEVNTLQYNFLPTGPDPDYVPAMKSYKTNATTVTLDMGSLLDQNIYLVLRDLDTVFPGSIRLRALKLVRTDQSIESLAEAFKDGQRPNLVSANIVFSWRTVDPLAAERGVSSENLDETEEEMMQ